MLFCLGLKMPICTIKMLTGKSRNYFSWNNGGLVKRGRTPFSKSMHPLVYYPSIMFFMMPETNSDGDSPNSFLNIREK